MKILLALLFSMSAFAAGTVQQSLSRLGTTDNWVLVFRWTGDSVTGTVPVTAAQLANCCQGYFITQAVTQPGSVAPTAGYTITIKDSSGYDLLGGAVTSLSSSVSQSFSAGANSPPLNGTFNLTIAGNSVASATGAVYVYIAKTQAVNVLALSTTSSSTSGNYIQISTYGAKCDGVTDDHAAFVQAIAAAIAVKGTVVVAGSGVCLTSSLSITATDFTMLVQSEVDLIAGSSITLAGTRITIKGDGQRIIKALGTTTDIFTVTGCKNCEISHLYLDRTGTASAGAGIKFASGDNGYFHGFDLYITNQYQGIWAAAVQSPAASMWEAIWSNANVNQGIRFDSPNDDHFVNSYFVGNGGHGVQVGNGSSTASCIGGFKLNNAVVYFNGGDGVHIEGASGATCTYVWVENSHIDTDIGYEIYTKNAGAVTINNIEIANGRGVWIGDGSTAVTINGMRIQGAAQEGLYVTNGATAITLAAMRIGDSNNATSAASAPATCSKGTFYWNTMSSTLFACTATNTWTSASVGGTFPAYLMRVNNSVTILNASNISIGAPNLLAAGGILVETGTGASSALHFSGMQFYNTGNMTTPVSIVAGLTDVSIDLGKPNYIAAESGSNNAIAGTLVGIVPLDGVCVIQQLGHTLQAGANTYNLNGSGAVAIKSSRAAATDIAAAYAATGRINLCYNSTGPVWFDMSQ